MELQLHSKRAAALCAILPAVPRRLSITSSMDRRLAQELRAWSPYKLLKVTDCWNLLHWRICRALLSWLASPSWGLRLWRAPVRLRRHHRDWKSRRTPSMPGKRERMGSLRKALFLEKSKRSRPPRPQHRDWRSGPTLCCGGVWMWCSTSTIRKCSTSFLTPGWPPRCLLPLAPPSCFFLGPHDLLLHQSLMWSSGKILHRSDIWSPLYLSITWISRSKVLYHFLLVSYYLCLSFACHCPAQVFLHIRYFCT